MALKMKRGDLFWVNLDPTIGSEIRKRRPCVVVGANPINKARRTVVVVPLSSVARPHPPLTVPVQAMGRQAVVVCDQIRAVDKSHLIDRAGNLSKADMQEIDKGLRQVLVL